LGLGGAVAAAEEKFLPQRLNHPNEEEGEAKFRREDKREE
jgi:hypothetical protein